MRAQRQGWATPRRLQATLKAEVEKHVNKSVEDQKPKEAGIHGITIAGNLSLAEQIETAKRAGKRGVTSPTSFDYDKAARDYRGKGVQKLGKLLDDTIIAPPRNWKDLDIADKMMRRLLGLDDGDNKSQTIVQLQVVNERLTQSREDIVEGEIVIPESPASVFHGEQSEEESDSITSYNESNV